MDKGGIYKLAEDVDRECGSVNGPGSEWLRVFAEKLLAETAEIERDTDRYRKLVHTINYLARVPHKLTDFIAVAAGSNKQGIDEQIDALPDLRLPYDRRKENRAGS